MRRNERGITLIALVVTIVVLLILAGVSISMLTGENGIITQAQESKLQTEIGKEKEYITLSVSTIRGDKIAKGDTSEITSSELQTEMNKYTDEATVTGSVTLTVTYESGRSYDVEQDGSITQKEELTPEEAKKIVFATGCGEALLVETADGTVYYVDDLQEKIIQKIEITDEEIVTTNGIREAGENYFIDNRGKVYTWGSNSSGQLGNGTQIGYDNYSIKPQCISDIEGNALKGKNVVKMQCFVGTMVAIDNEGKVYTWGENQGNQLGNGTDFNDSNVPICISNISGSALNGKNIKEIQSGWEALIALDSEGKVYTWGNNFYGNLGNGTNDYNSSEPICISDIEGNALKGKNIIEIQGGSTMIVLDSEGKVYTWGANGEGQLGNGTNEDSNEPMCISDIEGNALKGKNIIEIQGGSTMIVLDSEGKVYTWGDNDYGQLGNGTNEDSNEPICISDIEGNALKGKNIIEIQGGSTMISLDSEGKVYTWGDNDYGQLGNGTNDYYSSEPICISDIEGNALKGKNIIEVQGGSTMISLDSEGKVYIWGNNRDGVIITTSENYLTTPICITDEESTELFNKKIKLINYSTQSGQSIYYVLYVTQEGELYNYYFTRINS